MKSPRQAELQEQFSLDEALAARAVAVDAADSAAHAGQEPEAASRKRSPTQDIQADSSKRERLAETCDYCSQDTVTSPSYILGQPSSSMLDSWLEEDIHPEGEGPIFRGIREGLQVLVPMLVDGDGLLTLCQKLRDTKGACIVALNACEDTVKSVFGAWILRWTRCGTSPRGTWMRQSCRT